MFKPNRVRLANRLGCAIKVYRHPSSWSFYDGKALYLSSGCDNETVDHELGHFLAATKRERTKSEWGLERGPEFPNDEVLESLDISVRIPRTFYEDFTPTEHNLHLKRESTASLLGIAVSYTIGTKNEWRDHADLHQWDKSGTACDLFCLIKDTEHHDLKGRLTKTLAQLAQAKALL